MKVMYTLHYKNNGRITTQFYRKKRKQNKQKPYDPLTDDFRVYTVKRRYLLDSKIYMFETTTTNNKNERLEFIQVFHH